jgi:hypothetical protein
MLDCENRICDRCGHVELLPVIALWDMFREKTHEQTRT